MTEALLVAGHGSRDRRGTRECAILTDRIRQLRPGLPVELGFIELAPPPLHRAVAALLAQDATAVTVVPLVLLGAGHAKTDVPAAIARERREHPDVAFRYGRPLGIHPDLLAIVDERLDAALGAQPRDDVAVLLVGRGSSDPDANGDLAKVARLVWEGRPYPLVEVAYVGITGPRVVAGLERLRRLGARRVAVVPYLLFAGVLVDRIGEQARGYAAAHGLEVSVTGHLGPDPRVARLVLDRYGEARAGRAEANCDLCLHRTALPGFDHRVGAPQTLHHHPDDPATHGPRTAHPDAADDQRAAG